jgi:hypothetical protein
MKTYDTGKVRIGISYKAPMEMSRDEELLQNALINETDSTVRSQVIPLILGYCVVAVILTVIYFAYG